MEINDINKEKETYLANSCGSEPMLPCLITMNSHQMDTKTSFLYIVHLRRGEYSYEIYEIIS